MKKPQKSHLGKHQNFLLKAAVAFDWPLIIKAVTNHQQWPISYLHAKLEQNPSVNTIVTFKGHCGLCLAFDCKGHVTNHQQWPISYLHAKFEQNQSLNTKVTYKGRCGLCLAFDCKGHVTNHQ